MQRNSRPPFTQGQQVIELFQAIQAGRHAGRDPWSEFKLSAGEYAELERQLSQDEDLLGFVEDKIRYDYDPDTNTLTVRMPTPIHEQFCAQVVRAICRQLELISEGDGAAAAFAQQVEPAGSSDITLPAYSQSKYDPDATFWHDRAAYPGVIIEVAYSNKKKKLGRLAENYLLGSYTNIRVVIGLDIEYGKKGSRKATLSTWRTHVLQDELQVVSEVTDESFRDENGHPTTHSGLQLYLSDFACERLVQDELGDQDRELTISAEQLCRFLAKAEAKVHKRESLVKVSLDPRIKIRMRSETPPEQITPSDEARYLQLEEATIARTTGLDPDYEEGQSNTSSE